MPKTRTIRSFSRSSPYGRPSAEDHKPDWEGVRCPICMEQPHNAVLLKCSSHDMGCRPYMCDTSRRHSNCLDQFLKTSSSGPAGAAGPCGSRGEPGPACPLCRGSILGYSASWRARARLDPEPRSCSKEGCGFSGSYQELRRHARSDHPWARPAEVDPARRLGWLRLERQSEIQDVLNLVLNEDGLLGDEDDDDSDNSEDNVNPRRQPGGLTSLVESMLSFTSFFHRSMGQLHRSLASGSYLEGGSNQPHSSSVSPSPSQAPRHGLEQEQAIRTTTSASGTEQDGDFLLSNFRPARQLRFATQRSWSSRRLGGPARWPELPPPRTARWRSQRWSSQELRRLWP